MTPAPDRNAKAHIYRWMVWGSDVTLDEFGRRARKYLVWRCSARGTWGRRRPAHVAAAQTRDAAHSRDERTSRFFSLPGQILTRMPKPRAAEDVQSTIHPTTKRR